MYIIRENDISFSYNLVSNLTPLNFCFNQPPIANVDTSRPNYTCMHTHLFTVLQISLFRSCDITLRRNIITIQPSSASRNLQKVHNAVLLSMVGIHLVVCPQQHRGFVVYFLNVSYTPHSRVYRRRVDAVKSG